MAIPTDINGREFNKFKDVSGQPSVAVCNPDGTTLLSGATVSITASDIEIGSVDINGYETVGDGSKSVTTAGTRVQVSSSSVPTQEVTITANLANTGVIVVGGSTVVASSGTRRGIPLNAGDTVTLNASNLNLLYLDSTVNGEGVSYIYFVS